ncbi:ATP-binding protein [Gordonia sp. HY285]|uniref:AlbA family DNA-binding domain-containing protein n=1 Tax=Gordonia liuliyuniae TaxID=2911517 RepID=UPI001F427DD8|nr:ATP-binding protein [Gordonia liuliyuniae]MCF8609526.1 ATP-binding protein [Gordonia liuliyuniae]
MSRETTPLWMVSVALVIVLAVAWLLGATARWLLRGRANLRASVSVVLAILGTSVGLLVEWSIWPTAHLRTPWTVLFGLAGSVAAVFVYGIVAAHFQRPDITPVGELLLAGESDRLEFKSTARVNVRTGEKDARMEQVIAKTVSAFLNSDGGTLLIGVDDDGAPLGLDADYATLRVPDADRYELWLRDLLVTSVGQNAAAQVAIAVEDVTRDGVARPVCRLRAAASPRPVYLRPGKNTDREFWVRTGNSTRRLSVDEAAEYVMLRWPLGLGSSLAAQVKATVRFGNG